MCAVRIQEIIGFEGFSEFVSKLPENGPPVCFYFTGKKDTQGETWCSYCQTAEPVIRHFLSELKKDVICGFVNVGERSYWKDLACPFRKDPRLRIMCLPTILIWKGVQRLEGRQCAKVDLLQMLFEDDEE